MLAQVAGERGALPLAAFAMARLWDRRDRERGLLTRAAYDEIGGVGGALAQHAEATLERIGPENVPIVRELFRNLVTAQGTRATLDRDELLSVFGDDRAADGHAGTSGLGPRREQAAAVLAALVDARLLTSYEQPSDAGGSASAPRVEVVHESLLSAWPRLVRWRTQDQEGAQLRDQLRQVARLWEERGQPEDLLWTGTSYREYELWRERYAGQLTTSESAFAQAMTARTRRQRRRRRLGTAAALAAALAVAVAMGVLWRRSEAARVQAVAAARRAEAQQTFALGQLALQKDPTAALAFALASLERADSPHARLLALRALWSGPISMAVADTSQLPIASQLAFSPDGRWLAEVEPNTGTARVWERDGARPRVFPTTGGFPTLAWSADSRYMVVTQPRMASVYSMPGGELVRRIDEEFRLGFASGQDLITSHFLEGLPDGRTRRLFKIRRLPGGEPETLGVWTTLPSTAWEVDPIHQRLFAQRPDGLYEEPMRGLGRAVPRRVVREAFDENAVFVSPNGERIYGWSASGEGGIWSRASGARLPGPRLAKSPSRANRFSASGDNRWIAVADAGQTVPLWDLAGPVASEPRALRRDARMAVAAFEPSGSWLAVRDNLALALWPLAWRHPYVLRVPGKGLWGLGVDPRGRWIVAAGVQDALAWLWPLAPEPGSERRTFATGAGPLYLATSPRGDLLAAGTLTGLWLVPLDGRPPERLPGFEGLAHGLVFDAGGRRLAAGGGAQGGFPQDRKVRVYDLASRRVQLLDAGDGEPIGARAFLPDGRLLTTGADGARLWDLSTSRSTLVLKDVIAARASGDGRKLLGFRGVFAPGGPVGKALVHDLGTKETRVLETHGREVTSLAWDPEGQLVVTGSRDGTVRAGPATGEEPHLLLGHEGTVHDVAVDPAGRWIASAGEDGTVRLWPLPLPGRPFHTLPYEELLARLRSLTNFRVVPDRTAAGGYRLGFESLAGWSREPPSF